MRVALVTSEGRCGIAEHSAMLRQYVQAADAGIEFVSDPRWLDPHALLHDTPGNDPVRADLVHLNYHRGLHSRWTSDQVERIPQKVVITFHDTYEVQPDRLPWDLLEACDAMIVHEPCDLSEALQTYTGQALPAYPKVHYWRQGVPQPEGWIGFRSLHVCGRPIVGTCGFAFGWKGFELLCDAAKLAGWGVHICSHNATPEQIADWTARNPWIRIDTEYHSTPKLIAQLQQCDATAFLYSCANSGTSGAIRLGIAAGKSVLATEGCRQFRDLTTMSEITGIDWVEPDVEKVAAALSFLPIQRFNGHIVALRERDSWEHLGKRYADLYKELVP